ncbi:MAG: D-alanine--D-alanine ligase [Neisseriaceae bacterium]
MRFKKVIILYGGESAERGISLLSGQAVFDALNQEGIDVQLWDPAVKPLTDLAANKPEVVFIALHGGMGEGGEVQAALRLMNIPYTGSDAQACMLSMDKYLSKLVWHAQGLPTAPYVLVRSEKDWSACEALNFPLFLKPLREGSSVGVHKIKDRTALFEIGRPLLAEYSVLLAEAFLSGPEISCSILGDEALPVVRIEPCNEFYDYEAKYVNHNTLYHCPAGLTREQEEDVRKLALSAFRSCGCKGWGRVDLVQGSDGIFYLLELNTVPGMTTRSIVPRAAEHRGLDFKTLCLTILNYAAAKG